MWLMQLLELLLPAESPASSTDPTALQVPLVPYKDWLASLEACAANNRSLEDEGLQKCPALRLLDFFRNVEIREDKEPLGVARLDTNKAIRVSVALRTAPQLTDEWASRWFNAWKASGHLKRADIRFDW